MIKKFLVCFIILLVSLSSVNSLKMTVNSLKMDSAESFSDNENINFVIDKLKEIQEGGIDKEEIDSFIEILQEKFGGDSIYVNAMCKIAAIGAGILLPPFLPLSPVLIAFPFVVLDTTGLQGHWCHGVHIAIFFSFVGAPIYVMLPAIFIIAGFAGVVIGIVFD